MASDYYNNILRPLWYKISQKLLSQRKPLSVPCWSQYYIAVTFAYAAKQYQYIIGFSDLPLQLDT